MWSSPATVPMPSQLLLQSLAAVAQCRVLSMDYFLTIQTALPCR